MKASLAYSAMVQLYAQSGQLPTASGMKQKKKMEDSGCRYGCNVMEDMHHALNCLRQMWEIQGAEGGGNRDDCKEDREMGQRI